MALEDQTHQLIAESLAAGRKPPKIGIEIGKSTATVYRIIDSHPEIKQEAERIKVNGSQKIAKASEAVQDTFAANYAKKLAVLLERKEKLANSKLGRAIQIVQKCGERLEQLPVDQIDLKYIAPLLNTALNYEETAFDQMEGLLALAKVKEFIDNLNASNES